MSSHPYLADVFRVDVQVGRHSDLDTKRDGFITVAGQRRTFTVLSPLPLVAVTHQNRLDFGIVSHYLCFPKGESTFR